MLSESGEVGSRNEMTSSNSGSHNVSIKFLDALQRRNFEGAALLVETMDIPTLRESLRIESFSILCQKIPYSLVVMQSIYVRFLLLSPGNFPIDLLCVNDTIQTCVKFFYNDFIGTGGGGNSDAKRTYDNLCGDILRIISTVAPRNVEELKTNQKTVRTHVEGLGVHSLVSYNDQMLHLHDALHLELDEIINQYKQALKCLKTMNLVSAPVSKGKNPVSPISSPSQSPVKSPNKSTGKNGGGDDVMSKASGSPQGMNHQRLMEVTYKDVQQRLYKNKAFWNVIQPSFETSPLIDLYDSLCERIHLDKKVLVSGNDICRHNANDKLGVTLTNYLKAIEKALYYMIPNDETPPSENGYSSSYPGSCNVAKSQMVASESKQPSESNIPISNYNFGVNTQEQQIQSPKKNSKKAMRRQRRRAKDKRSRSQSNPASPVPGQTPNETYVKSGSSRSENELQSSDAADNVQNDFRDSRYISPLPKLGNEVDRKESQSVLQNGTVGDISSSLPSSQSGDSNGDFLHFATPQNIPPGHRATSVSTSATTPRNVKFNAKRNSEDSSREEVELLRSRINQLEIELQGARQSIHHLQKREETLMNRISDSIQRKVESSGSFETLSDSNRPSQLIERYSQLLYCELRPDAMDALDDIIGVSEADDHQQISDSDSANVEAIAHSTDLKQKILFSVVVLSFRSVQRSIEESTRQVFVLLGMSAVSEEDAAEAVTKKLTGLTTASTASSSSTPTGSNSGSPKHTRVQSASDLSTSEEQEEMQKVVMEQMRKTAASRNTDPNFNEVCQQLFQTLFDYPSLKTCKPLLNYVRECCKLAWLLLLSNPSYHINYHHTNFDPTCMNRFHSSDQSKEEVVSFIWPALIEQTTGHCVSKAIVVT